MNGSVDFPHVGQVMCIESFVTKLDGSSLRKQDIELIFCVTSLTPETTSPARLLELHRGHWAIENKVHYVRDVTFDEDRCQVAKKSAPQVMASFRNFAINLLRMAGATAGQTAAATRYCARKVRATLRLIGL